jgi:hypothetical protein
MFKIWLAATGHPSSPPFSPDLEVLFMRTSVFLFGALSLTCFAPSVFAVDLTKIDRTIRKEPAYRTKPRYALLVLGAKAETRIWLVIDGKTLYVDRNGNGDLTEKGERVSAEKSESTDYLAFRAGAFIEADGKTKHSNLTVNQYFARQFGRLVNSVGIMDVLDAFGQTTNGENGCSFGDSPRDAPIIHLNGPLSIRAHSAVVEYPGGSKVKEFPFKLEAAEKVSELHVQVGTPGLGEGTFGALAVEKGFPASVHPTLEVIVPSKNDPKKTIKAEFLLKQRC